MFNPTLSLADVVRHTHQLGAAYPSLSRSNQGRTSAASRAALPDATVQLDCVLPVALSRAEKHVLDLLANWPFCSAEQLAGLIDGVSKRHANQLLRSLRAQGLIQREELGFVLSDQSLATLARRDRAAVGPTLDRWTPLRDEVGYIGSALQTMANQHRHQAGITEFCAMLSAEAAHSRDHEILDLLPAHRSQISYEHRGTRYMLYPDASFQLGAGDDWYWCLLEFERRATTPKRVPERLLAYRRYLGSDYVRPDHNGQLPLVLFVFESEQAETIFLDTAEGVAPMPFLSSHLEALRQDGILGRSWRAWGANSPDRHRLQQFGQLLTGPTHPCRGVPVGSRPAPPCPGPSPTGCKHATMFYTAPPPPSAIWPDTRLHSNALCSPLSGLYCRSLVICFMMGNRHRPARPSVQAPTGRENEPAWSPRACRDRGIRPLGPSRTRLDYL